MPSGCRWACRPGPVNAAIAAAAARRSYVDGIKIGLGAMTADFTFLVLTVIGVAVLLTGTLARNAISVVGGLILLYFAYVTLKSYKKSAEVPGSVGQATIISWASSWA